jgi:hypothetical protein
MTQTVIFDCCHAGSSTRDGFNMGLLPRGIELSKDYLILSSIDEDFRDIYRKGKVPKGYEMEGLASHVLLAACSFSESAYESNGRGHFTQSLVTFLYDIATRGNKATYVDVIEHLPELLRYVHLSVPGMANAQPSPVNILSVKEEIEIDFCLVAKHQVFPVYCIRSKSQTAPGLSLRSVEDKCTASVKEPNLSSIRPRMLANGFRVVSGLSMLLRAFPKWKNWESHRSRRPMRGQSK